MGLNTEDFKLAFWGRDRERARAREDLGWGLFWERVGESKELGSLKGEGVNGY